MDSGKCPSDVEINQKIQTMFERIRLLDDDDKLHILAEIEQNIEKGERRLKVSENILILEDILNSGCKEEELHRFILNNRILWGGYAWDDERSVTGVLSKFPIAPDRVVDLFCFRYRIGTHQGPANVIKIIEFKRPSARIFAQNGRMSQDLNDGWIECNEAIRLLLMNYPDVIRRSTKAIEKRARFHVESDNTGIGKSGFVSLSPPRVRAELYIGRRRILTTNELEKLRGLAHGPSVSAFTYDHLIDQLRDQAAGHFSNYHW